MRVCVYKTLGGKESFNIDIPGKNILKFTEFSKKDLIDEVSH